MVRPAVGCCEFELVGEESGEDTIRVNCVGCPYGSSLEDSEVCMLRTMNKLSQVRTASRVILAERRLYEYGQNQTAMLKEIVRVIEQIRATPQLFSPAMMGTNNIRCTRCFPARFRYMQTMVTDTLRRDPVSAYVDMRRTIRHEEMYVKKEVGECQACTAYYVSRVLNVTLNLLEGLHLIRGLKPYIEGHREGDRSIYQKVLKPAIRPNFMLTRMMADFPADSEEVDNYTLRGDIKVTCLKVPGAVRFIYHTMPPELRLSEDEFGVLDMARQVLAAHNPESAELLDPERMRTTFLDISKDLISEFALREQLQLDRDRLDVLGEVLTRETTGYGILEVMLADERAQDLSVNAPPGELPVFIFHADFEDMESNIIPTREEVESWAARMRLSSGRPLDQANPILDTSIELPFARARVCAVTRSLSAYGLGFSIRRHRDNPWTHPLFMKVKMINALGCGLMSFFIDGARTMLICGTRGSGKSAFLGSNLIEIMRRYRIITIEDTLELPTVFMRKLGFNILSMKVGSAVGGASSSELSPADGIRASLRLGDSALILGEVRSLETLALYEAMRVGAAANVVAGTIHGDSPFGVFDRVVNDLGVPKTSFKATDIIVFVRPIRSADGLHKLRRVTEIVEVGKEWVDDPERENAFHTLMEYDTRKDTLIPTSALIDGESEAISSISGTVKEWVGNFDAVWANIEMRAEYKQRILDHVTRAKMPQLLEAPFVVRCNDMFHILVGEVTDELGSAVPDEVLGRWTLWLRKSIKEERGRKK